MSTRDEARQHWLELMYSDEQRIAEGRAAGIPAETLEWLRDVARQMTHADGLPAAERREAAYEASGLKGESPAWDEADRTVLMIALREYEKQRDAGKVRMTTAAEFIAQKLDWDTGHDVAPASLRRRVQRMLETMELDPAEAEWARALLLRK
ncbi:MAG: hypothetical protein KF863_10355 [Rubrivivax sp.]|nr:hypothetical protein [Rubrivivax sp.]